jgi:microcystin-dependent protein
MSEPFVGEIRMFGFQFAPRNWAICQGQLMAIAQNDALFALIGTTYGGDGQATFGLPDFRGRIPIHQGTGPGLSNYPIGQNSGSENVTVTVQQIPSHSHNMYASTSGVRTTSPANDYLGSGEADIYNRNTTASQTSLNSAIGNAGGSQPHNNIQPALCVNFCISLFGVFPTRN